MSLVDYPREMLLPSGGGRASCTLTLDTVAGTFAASSGGSPLFEGCPVRNVSDLDAFAAGLWASGAAVILWDAERPGPYVDVAPSS